MEPWTIVLLIRLTKVRIGIIVTPRVTVLKKLVQQSNQQPLKTIIMIAHITTMDKLWHRYQPYMPKDQGRF